MRKLACLSGKIIFSILPRGKESKIDLKKEDNAKKIKKILIFKVGAIGDIIMTTPFLRVLRKRFPKAEITYMTSNFCREVLVGNPNIDRIETFDQNIFYKKNLKEASQLIKRVQKERYDICFICDMHYMINLLVYFFKIPIRIGFDRYGEGFPNTHNVSYTKVKHAIDYYLELAYLTGARKLRDNSEKQPEISISKKDELFAEKFLKQNSPDSAEKMKELICVAIGGAKNPGQDMQTRKWPAEKFKELVDVLIKKGYPVLLLGNKDDNEIIKKYGFDKKAVNAAGKTTIKQCCALLKKCRFLITNDAGIMHMAEGMKTPTLSLFGVTDPRRKAPLATKEIPHAYIWKKPTLKGWNDDGVFHDFDKVTDINRISVKEVMQKAEEMLKRE